MANKIGNLIKKVRTDAGFSQDQLARQIPGLSAADLSKAERGEKKLENDILKQIAKLTGVTQKSLLEAAASSRYPAASASAKPAATSKPAANAKASTTSASSGVSIKVTATEKKLVELYRAADSAKRKEALKILKGEQLDADDILSTIINTAAELFGKK